MNILVVTQKYDINDSNLGAFIGWWDKLAGKMEKIYILALEKHSESTLSNIEVLSMGKEKGVDFFGKILGFYIGLFKTIKHIDAILVHMIPKYVILAAPVAFIFRKPIYFWYTGVSANYDLRIAVKLCRKVFTAHEAAMRISTPKRIITGHGIDTSLFKISNLSPRSSFGGAGKSQISTVTILSVGRITPSKGHDLIIRTAAELIKSRYNIKLTIIGGIIQNYHREYLKFLKELATNLQINDKIEFLGDATYDKMPFYLNQSQILVNAVPFGGLDKAVLEAMASGVIPLTSNGAFLTVFPEKIATQLIFKEGDLKDLENKLRNITDKKLYQDEELINELRNIVVKNHNLDHLISRIVEEIF